jgi:UTP:GlnB (protein PII) uridylyltransferase
MDKATLLAEVITQVREMKKTVTEASKGFLIPTDADEVRVESCEDGAEEGAVSYRASVCCDYRPQLYSELRQAIDVLQLEMVKVETSTLGSRVKTAFVFTCCRGDNINLEESQSLANLVHQTLSSLLDKAAAMPECSPTTEVIPSKRRRAAFFDTSCSNSSPGKLPKCCSD